MVIAGLFAPNTVEFSMTILRGGYIILMFQIQRSLSGRCSKLTPRRCRLQCAAVQDLRMTTDGFSSFSHVYLIFTFISL